MRTSSVLWLVLVRCAAHAREERADDADGVPSASVTTQTPSGLFRGTRMTSRLGRSFEAYRGIPYADSPLGERRFQASNLIERYEGVVDATEDGPACPQPPMLGVTHIDEDCLRLNVYTPSKNSSEPLPVVVYLHYGGFYVLSSRSEVAGPHYLMDRNLVLVTFNFRLASLGFISTGDKLAPGNNGFKDQVMALRWVRKNIASFGGDPGCVTLLGIGSGSYSAALHLVSPMSKGLFHRAISISSSPFSQVVIARDQYELAAKQARLVGCPDSSSTAIISCLKTKNWQELGNSTNGFIEFGSDRVLYWTAVVENDFGQERFLTQDPLDALRSGNISSVPCIVSQTRDEFSYLSNVVLNDANLTEKLNKEYAKYAPLAFLLPRSNSAVQAPALRRAYLGDKQLENDSESAENLGKFFGDALIGFSAHRLANLMCRNSADPVYYYQFDYVGNNSFYMDPDTNKPTGVAHHDDLIYLLSMPALFPLIGRGGADALMLDRMTAILYDFAKYGDPNARTEPELTNLTWPTMTPTNRRYLRISSNFSVHQNLFEDRFRTWDELYPIVYTPKPRPVKPAPPGLLQSTVNSLLGLFNKIL